MTAVAAPSLTVTSGSDLHPGGHTTAWSHWRTGTRWSESAPMNGGVDLDVADYMRWASQLRGLAPNTLRIRYDVLERLHAFIGVPLRTAEPGQLLAFEQACIAGRAPETRRAYASHVRAFFRWGIDNGIVTADPSTLLTIPIIPKHLPRPVDEADALVAIAAARTKLAAMMTLAAFAGLRCCEISGIDWPDVHRVSPTSGWLHVRKAKGSKERTVQFGAEVINALQAHGPKRRGAVFLGRDGQRIAARSVSRNINRHFARIGMDYTAHQLRHRYATTAYQLSRDLRMVQEQCGHASPNTTQIYTLPSQDSAARMVAAMDAHVAEIRATLSDPPRPPKEHR